MLDSFLSVMFLQPDAHAVAAEEQTRYDEELRARQREKIEQQEKARVRHNHAVHREITKNVRDTANFIDIAC